MVKYRRKKVINEEERTQIDGLGYVSLTVSLLAYVPIKIQECQYPSVLRFVNKIQMDNLDLVNLFINEDCNQLMSLSALNVGSDFRVDEEVFRFAFCPLLNILDDHFIEFIRIISAGDEEQVPDLDLSELLSLSEQNDPEAQYAVFCLNLSTKVV